MTANAKTLDTLIAALADPNRRRAVELLGEGPRRAGELADLLHLPAPAMSRHLRTLREAGLITETQTETDHRVRIYSLQSQRLTELKDWLARAEQGWTEQLTAFKRHVETRHKGARPKEVGE